MIYKNHIFGAVQTPRMFFCFFRFVCGDGRLAADFFNIVAWRNTAEFVSRYFSKGRMAVVQGRLQIRSWTDKDGNKRRNAEVIADNVYFGDSRKDDSDGFGVSYDAQPEVKSQGFADFDDDDSDLPF